MKKDRKIFIIAEIGVNHNGSIEIAKRLINKAAESGVDAVKLQTFKADNLLIKSAPKALYQKKATGKEESQFEMIKKLELTFDDHKELIRHCKKNKISFLSSPFDLESIDLLNKLKIKIFKIPSGEITNLPYLRKIGRLNKKVILSTGMSNLSEIENALNILVREGTSKGNITVLHCNTEYPTPFKDVNLYAMLTIKDTFNIKVGYSDHTVGIEIPIAAAALGATVIEKHLTLNKTMKGPDHKASLEPAELMAMVRAIRNIELSLGDGFKRPSYSEQKNSRIVRKSIAASRDIKQGEIFNELNIATKRPAAGISAMKWDEIIGRRAKRPFKKDELIKI